MNVVASAVRSFAGLPVPARLAFNSLPNGTSERMETTYSGCLLTRSERLPASETAPAGRHVEGGARCKLHTLYSNISFITRSVPTRVLQVARWWCWRVENSSVTRGERIIVHRFSKRSFDHCTTCSGNEKFAWGPDIRHVSFSSILVYILNLGRSEKAYPRQGQLK